MPNYDPNNGEVLILTYKEGMLSALAHDLKIKVTKFTISADAGVLKGDLDASSLRVVNAMKDGNDDGSLLDKAKQHPEIEKNIVDEVLHAGKNPSIKFEGKIVGAEVVGNLTLNGTTKEIRGVKKEEPGKVIAEFKLNQPDFGVKPFSAMFGTLKVKPEVLVRVTLPR